MQMRKYILSFVKTLLMMLLFISKAHAQTAAPAQQPADAFPSWLNSDFYLFVVAIFFILLLVVVLGNSSIHLSKAAAKLGKKSSATVLLLLVTISAFAQAASEATAAKPAAYFPEWADNPNVYVFGAIFLVMAFAVYALY